MQFRVAPIAGKFLLLDAAVTSVRRTLLLLQGLRVSWLVLRDGGKYFVYSMKEVTAALKSANPAASLAAAVLLNGVEPSTALKSIQARVDLAQGLKSGTPSSRAVVLRTYGNGRRSVLAIGTWQRDLIPVAAKQASNKKAARKKMPPGAAPGKGSGTAKITGGANKVPAFGIAFTFAGSSRRAIISTDATGPALAPATGRTQSFSVVDVFYATDREVKPSNSSNTMVRYLNRLARKSELDYGVCSVTVPAGHALGIIESPSIWSFEMREDPEKHFTIRGCAQRPASAFFQELTASVDESGKKSCFVFIHGYNVAFEDAAKRTAQLACDLKFLGTPILYSWASAASWRKYAKDVETVDLTVETLSAFLTRLTQSLGAKNIHLIAHSMGNRALIKALKQMTPAAGGKPFKQVVLTAPDVPRQHVEPLIGSASEKAERVTLYASSQDKALGLSKVKNDYERLGKVYGFPFVLEGMDSIDASRVKTDFWEHTVFAKARTVLGDLAALITDGRPPDERFGLKRVTSPNGVSWLILP